ncbi:MAG: hypothetical protein JST53_13115 [Actinobacteria bacterium]|nr:hypothetical protein [Actinomycetota bacterium]
MLEVFDARHHERRILLKWLALRVEALPRNRMVIYIGQNNIDQPLYEEGKQTPDVRGDVLAIGIEPEDEPSYRVFFKVTVSKTKPPAIYARMLAVPSLKTIGFAGRWIGTHSCSVEREVLDLAARAAAVANAAREAPDWIRTNAFGFIDRAGDSAGLRLP